MDYAIQKKSSKNTEFQQKIPRQELTEKKTRQDQDKEQPGKKAATRTKPTDGCVGKWKSKENDPNNRNCCL